ncbi:MAG: Holliday junction branch migration protein RuvA [Nitrospirae bacterium]|nr:Holliday junction branch migration protein RuvA [Nitrospirota bacterium]
MIASIKGRVFSKKPEGIIVDVGGVGYLISVPLCSLCNIPEPGAEVFLHTYLHVREDALQLYGFLSEEERRVFVTLLGINGIGPKLGLAILSGMPVQKFTEAVANEDISSLTSIPGLGQKTASRLILELKEKLPKIVVMAKDHISVDAVSALVNFGYKKAFAEAAVGRAVKNGSDSIENIIREALKYLTSHSKI